MSIIDRPAGASGADEVPTGVPSPGRRPLHRLAVVRRAQGVSRRALARRLKTDVNHVKRQEQTSDIPLSILFQWQEALEVPLGELLAEPEDALSSPVLKRARMVRLMKTATAIQQRSQQPSVRRLAGMLIEQLAEIMPELKEVSPWHAVGQRRSRNELGQAACRRISLDVFLEDTD